MTTSRTPPHPSSAFDCPSTAPRSLEPPSQTPIDSPLDLLSAHATHARHATQLSLPNTAQKESNSLLHALKSLDPFIEIYEWSVFWQPDHLLDLVTFLSITQSSRPLPSSSSSSFVLIHLFTHRLHPFQEPISITFLRCLIHFSFS